MKLHTVNRSAPTKTRTETHSETLPDGFLNQEDLGDGSLEGVDTIGTRVTRIFNPGAFGNDNQ